MKEIKFRVYEKQSKEFNYFTFSNIMQYREVFQRHVINGNTFQQYSGIKDIKNKDIYEGDIVKYWNGTISAVNYETNLKYENKCYIKTEKKISVIVFQGSSYCLKNNNPVSSFKQESEIEIIGNIFQNPELIGE